MHDTSQGITKTKWYTTDTFKTCLLRYDVKESSTERMNIALFHGEFIISFYGTYNRLNYLQLGKTFL